MREVYAVELARQVVEVFQNPADAARFAAELDRGHVVTYPIRASLTTSTQYVDLRVTAHQGTVLSRQWRWTRLFAEPRPSAAPTVESYWDENGLLHVLGFGADSDSVRAAVAAEIDSTAAQADRRAVAGQQFPANVADHMGVRRPCSEYLH